jgi:uncharacterized repeat protein (TIGR01451 family)
MRARRGLGGVALLGLLGMGLAVLPPASVAADPFDDNCAGPFTFTAVSNESYSLAAGQSLLVPGGVTYTGSINGPASGARICIQGGGTFSPQNVNNPRGAIYNRGQVTLSNLNAETGFSLFNGGAAAITSNLNFNGQALLTNAVNSTMTISGNPSLNVYSEIANAGTLTFTGGFNLDATATLTNTGTVTIAGDFNPNGHVVNAGRLTVEGNVNINSSAVVDNDCTFIARRGLNNNSVEFTNGGLLLLNAGTLNNNGRITSETTGYFVGVDFTNNRDFLGPGHWYFTGNTVTQGTFSGTPARPDGAVFYDITRTPPPPIFDTQNGVVTNTVRQAFTPPDENYVSPGCAVPGPEGSADVTTTKTGPASVQAGATFTYTIQALNHGPDAAADVVITDTLPAGVVVVNAGGGTVSGGTVTWDVGTLDPNETATRSLTVQAPASGALLNVVASTATTPDPDPSSNDGSQDQARVTTDVEPVPPPNNPPTVEDMSRSIHTGETLREVLVLSDPDEGQTVTVDSTPVTAPAHGTVVLESNGDFAYTPTGTFTGVDSFVVRACDNGSPQLCDTGTVTIFVRPLALPDLAATHVDTPVAIPVLGNDQGDAGPPVVTTPPLHGTVVVNADGTITYTPAPGYVGGDGFVYEICSPTSALACDSAFVLIAVVQPNRPPVVADLDLTTTVDSGVAGTVTATDPDAGQTITFTTAPVTPPANGTATVAADGAVTYQPTIGFAGIDSFVVGACDSGDPVLCGQGTVTVRVSPVAGDDSAATAAGEAVNIDVLANDLGTVGLPAILTDPVNGGAAVVNGDGTVTYTPGPGFAGEDTFSYRICALNDPTLCDDATVLITVEPPPNNPPVVGDEAVATQVDVPVSGTVTATDPDGDPVAFGTAPVTPPANGTVDIGADGAFTYTPNAGFAGLDSFVVEACDDGDPALCDQGTVTVTVSPLATDDAAATRTGVPVTIDVAANDAGIDPATIAVSPPANGTATANGDGTVTYTSTAGFVGVDTFTYQVCAANQPQLCATATVTLTVSPVARPDVTRTAADVAVAIPLVDNDSGLITEPAVTVAPVNGRVDPGGPGEVVYTPNPGYTGVDLFTYEICDAETATLCDRAVVGVGVFPTAVDDEGSTLQDQPVTVDVEANDSGAGLVLSIVRPPSNGSAVVGSVVYTPAAGFVGPDSLDYQACSPNAASLCDQATVRLTVISTAPGPSPSPSPSPSPGGGSGGTGGSGGSGSLSRTGAEAVWLVGLGVALVLLGAASVAISRRTPRRRPRHAARA